LGQIENGLAEPFVGTLDLSMRVRYTGFGGWVFVDATFVEASIGFFGGPLTATLTEQITEFGFGSFSITERFGGSFFALNLGLLGKLPFALGEGNVSVFPLLGIGYNAVLSSRVEGESVDSPGDSSSFRIKFGVGGDFDVRENVFFRASLLGFYRFRARDERDAADLLRSMGFHNVTARGGFGMGIRVGVGVRL